MTVAASPLFLNRSSPDADVGGTALDRLGPGSISIKAFHSLGSLLAEAEVAAAAADRPHLLCNRDAFTQADEMIFTPHPDLAFAEGGGGEHFFLEFTFRQQFVGLAGFHHAQRAEVIDQEHLPIRHR